MTPTEMFGRRVIERGVDRLRKQRPVRESGQRVVVRLVLLDRDLSTELVQQIAASKRHRRGGRQRLGKMAVRRVEGRVVTAETVGDDQDL